MNKVDYQSYTVLVIAPTAYPLGGVAVWLDYLLNGLSQQGVNIIFGALDGKYHGADAYLKQYPYSSCIKIRDQHSNFYGRVKAIKRAVSESNPDILVSVNIPDVYCAARELKKTSHPDIKVVSTLHGLLDNLILDIEYYCDSIDHVVVTNKLTQQMVEHLTPINNDCIHYAPYGVVEQTGKRKRIAGQPLQLLYSGRIDNTQKRCSDLVDIVIELEKEGIDFQLNIAGDGPYKEVLLYDLSQVVTKKSKVNYLGLFDAQDMVEKVYKQSDVLLLTSDWETGPIVIWEAMACGLSVVTSRYNGLDAEAALEHRHNCLIFDIGDTQLAANHIKQLLNYDCAEKLKENAYELIKQRYSREKSLSMWKQTFDLIATAKPKFSGGLLTNSYPKRGLIERFFGFRCAFYIRKILNKPPYIDSAGAEWPHRHSTANEQYKRKFADTLANLNQLARNNDK